MSPEGEITAQELQARADDLIAGFRAMVDHGLPKDSLQIAVERDMRQFEDLALVGLGLKPASAVLHLPIYAMHQGGTYYLDDLPGGIKTSPERPSAWSPQLVIRVLEEHRDLVRQVHGENPVIDEMVEVLGEKCLDPNDQAFSAFLTLITGNNVSESATVLAGLLHGIPEDAARLFARHYRNIINTVQDVWYGAEGRKIPTRFREGLGMRTLATNEDGERDEFIRLERYSFAQQLHLDPEVVRFISRMRESQTPGTTFITQKGMTIRYEARLTQSFAISGFTEKFRRFLEE